jgi:hypothetical protein
MIFVSYQKISMSMNFMLTKWITKRDGTAFRIIVQLLRILGNLQKRQRNAESMSVNVTINVMGTKEDIQKLFEALSQPNEYGGAGIKLDRNSIRPVEGTSFPLWEAKGETDKMPERDDKNEFKNLYADFPALSINLRIFSDDGKGVKYHGGKGRCGGQGTYEADDESEFDEFMTKFFYDQWKLGYIPETVTMTEAMSLEAVKENGLALQYVPNEYKTAGLCLEAVKENGLALHYVPNEYKAADLCSEAVKQNGYSLQFVPEELKTAELCLEAVKQNVLPTSVLQFVPEELKTAEMCLEAVKRYGPELEFVPDKFKTAELCFEALKDSFHLEGALEFVPDKLKTETCLEAVKRSDRVFQRIPDELKTLELCLEAVKQNRRALCFVPEELKTAVELAAEEAAAKAVAIKE